ncbi:MAG: GntG family PLP-dependent aldolase [Pirellulales bacterium]
MIDLRSDTLTKPTPGMRAAMADAVVGDDVFGEDPTVRALEERVAALLGKDEALFVPSGSMSNQIGVRLHCTLGDELICEGGCHIYNYEQAGYAQLTGAAARPVDAPEHVLRLELIRDLVRADNDHLPRTRLLCLENTHNRGSGRILPLDDIGEMCAWAHGNDLATHLDGARLMNAVVATGIDAAAWSSHFDTVSICFSKGLGAPVGSALAFPREMAKAARRHRKVLGGGMRQAGILAAAALYALDHNVRRLAEDHEKAQTLAAAVRQAPHLTLQPDEIDTNIVIFSVDPDWGTAPEFVAALAKQGVLTLAVSNTRVRAVTHLDVSTAQVKEAAEILASLASSAPAASSRVPRDAACHTW